MNYTPTNWVAHETLISADRMNNIEAGIAGLYPQETIIAPEQTVTITSETDPRTGVPITLAEGIDLSTFSEADVRSFKVSINGEAATLNTDVWMINVDGGVAVVFMERDPDDGVIIGLSLGALTETEDVLPGDYTVKITKGAPARIPAVAAFPVSAGSGSVQFVIDAPVEEVDAAMVNGCVLLYSAAPSDTIGFAFGILVGHIAYYYATLTKDPFEWSAANVDIADGKYVIAGVA